MSAGGEANVVLDAVETGDVQTFQKGDALAEGVAECDLSVHSGVGDAFDSLLCMDHGGEFVDGFLHDEGGVEVEDGETLGLAGDGDVLEDEVCVVETFEMGEGGTKGREMDRGGEGKWGFEGIGGEDAWGGEGYLGSGKGG